MALSSPIHKLIASGSRPNTYKNHKKESQELRERNLRKRKERKKEGKKEKREEKRRKKGKRKEYLISHFDDWSTSFGKERRNSATFLEKRVRFFMFAFFSFLFIIIIMIIIIIIIIIILILIMTKKLDCYALRSGQKHN